MTGWRTWALMPLVVPQALWVAARATRLPEADGPRQGHTGEGPPLRLLVLGDSSAAGVGVPRQSEALVGRLVARLSGQFSVRWSLVAASGLTASGMRRVLSREADQTFDVAVIALGVNDTKNGVHPDKWRLHYTALLSDVQDRFGVKRVYASGVPPLGDFPLLPHPLRDVLGRRAARFDAILADICAAQPGVHHMPFDVPLDPALMADDGFHPGPEVYDLWAQRIVDHMRGAPVV